ncbi:MAG TPA: aminotransferase class IV [Actinomycetes bacterium]|nr:aminotransferase class IV [Actinomycetes bacterium]
MKVWVNDQLIEPDAARISPFDHGFTVGDGVFETCKVTNGEAFALTRHLRRLDRSASGLGLPAPDHDEIRRGIAELLSVEPPAGRLRITVTGGPGPLGSDRGDEGCTITLAVSPESKWEDATSVTVVPWLRNERSAVAGLKTTSYAENVVALDRAHGDGSSEAIFANTVGALCEGTGSNIFLVKDGEIVTPPLASGCLAGITRELVIEWTNAREIDLTMDDLRSADEALLTSSTRDVQPIRQVVWPEGERQEVSVGAVGEKARQVFAERAASDIDP